MAVFELLADVSVQLRVHMAQFLLVCLCFVLEPYMCFADPYF
jgi:hypothetical protein